MKEQQISDTSEMDSSGDNFGTPKEQNPTVYGKYYHDFFNDKFVREIIHPNKDKGYFVDCGATDGILQSQTLRFEEDGWDGICIEPNWAFHDELEKNRKCIIEKSAIVPKVYEGMHAFKQKEAHTLSHVIFNANEMSQKTYDVPGISITSILQKHDAPIEIDFMGIDIEGKFGDAFCIEEQMLEELIKSKYKVNFFSIEHYWPPSLEKVFNESNYVKVFNPFLKGIWLNRKDGLTYTLSPWGHFICQQFGNEVEIDMKDLSPITWECYYVHIDVVKKNSYLKRFLNPLFDSKLLYQ